MWNYKLRTSMKRFSSLIKYIKRIIDFDNNIRCRHNKKINKFIIKIYIDCEKLKKNNYLLILKIRS